MGLATNADQLVEMAVIGYVSQPTVRGYIPHASGEAMILPGMSGFIYNGVRVGDSALSIMPPTTWNPAPPSPTPTWTPTTPCTISPAWAIKPF